MPNFVPKSLLTRFLLIITVPTIIGQLVAVYIFYDRHWYSVSRHTSSLIVREIGVIAQAWERGDLKAADSISKDLKIEYEFHKNKTIKQKHYKDWEELEIFQQTLSGYVKQPSYVHLSREHDRVIVDLQFKDGVMSMQFASKPLMNPTTYLFVLWILFLTALLLAVSLVFSKNQIRSILELASAADEFGRGVKHGITYKPSGALEIRKAGLAFIRMSDRIERQIERRTQMLAMISHDLRTPLTRIKLELEMMDPSEETKGITTDVQSMEQMIASYLDFARGESGEDFKTVELCAWFSENLVKLKMANLELETNFEQKDALLCSIRPTAFKRAMWNILGNSAKYASKAKISLYKQGKYVVIDIEDNGVGVSDDEKALVFKPFYRSDKARGITSQPSVGLGLAITREIIIKHEGVIALKDSDDMGGLLVKIILPIKN